MELFGTVEDRFKCREHSETLLPNKIEVILTHGDNCPDGAFAAMLFKKESPGAAIYGLNPGSAIPDSIVEACAGKNVMMVDISPSTTEDYTRLLETAKIFVVLDHHASASKHESRLNFVIVKSLSGASMAYYYINKILPRSATIALACVHARDLFQFKPNQACDISQLKSEKYIRDFSLVFAYNLRKFKTLEEQIGYANQVCTDDAFLEVEKDSEGIAESLNAAVESIWVLSRPALLRGEEVFIVDLCGKETLLFAMNDAGSILSEQCCCPFAFVKSKNGNIEISFRGRGSLKLAYLLDGGGHECAAACTIIDSEYASAVILCNSRGVRQFPRE